MMDRHTTFADSLFYDVSAWTLPLAFGLPVADLDRIPDGTMGKTLDSGSLTFVKDSAVGGLVAGSRSEAADGHVAAPRGVSAYAFSWDRYGAPRALAQLLSAGANVEVVTRPTTFEGTEGEVTLGRGAIVLPVAAPGNQDIASLLAGVAAEDGVEVQTLISGAAIRGVDLGSPTIRSIREPKVLLATGSGTSSYETGEVWHLLDARFGIQVTRIGRGAVPAALHDYTHLILTSGSYDWTEEQVVSIRNWVDAGGVLIAMKSAVAWVQGREWITLETRVEGPKPVGPQPYESAELVRGARTLGGAIFAADIDVTHPLAYGYHRPEIAVFRNSRTFLAPSVNPYETVVKLQRDPLLSGYLHPAQKEAISGSASLVAKKMGRGTLALFVDDPSFRAFWYGTERLLLNAVFFGSLVEGTPE
jgi:hypothetical protein